MKIGSHFNTLFNKMFLVMALAVLIPIALLGILSYDKSRETLESVTSQFLQDNLGLNAKQIIKLLSSVEDEADRMVASRAMQSLLSMKPPESYENEVELSNRMSQTIAQLNSSYTMHVIPSNIEQYPHYLKLMKITDLLTNAEFFDRARVLKNKGYWMHIWDNNLQKPLFIYVRAVRDSEDKDMLGVVTLQIPEYFVRDALAFPSSFKNYTLIIVDHENYIISHPQPDFYNKKYYYEEYFPTEDWKKAEIQLNEDGWKLVAAVPRKELTGNIDQIKDFTYWIVLGSMLVITLFLIVVVRTFTIPIKKLVLHMNEVRRGLLNQFRSYNSRQDEIGQLVRGYNQMVIGMADLLETTKEMESDKRQLELQTLNHQINPHFFYNTLDAIKWRAESGNETTIATMVTKLANLLRFSLNNGEEWTTVEREIEHARNYLDIELLRSNRSFQIFVQIAPEIRKLKIIKLLLQPIMENAVKHGINRLPEGKGKIRLTAKRNGEDLIFIIEDNGPGVAGKHMLELDRSTENVYNGGIGLRNVHKRMQLHFGPGYGIQIDTDKLTGFRVMIRHPITANNE